MKRYSESNSPQLHTSLRKGTQKLNTKVVLGKDREKLQFLFSIQKITASYQSYLSSVMNQRHKYGKEWENHLHWISWTTCRLHLSTHLACHNHCYFITFVLNHVKIIHRVYIIPFWDVLKLIQCEPLSSIIIEFQK